MRRLIAIRPVDNAYRTLGLSASADQAAVENAARRMRIWTDPRRIPPTPWDLPWLGPLSRSRADIDRAVARINDPATRVSERLLWFHGPTPPTRPAELADVTAHTADSQATQHNSVLADLCAGDIDDPDIRDAMRWDRACGAWLALSVSADYASWARRVEADGQFEKAATGAEVDSAIAAFPSILADALAPAAEAAFTASDFPRCAAIVQVILRAADADPSLVAPRRLFDRLEDLVRSRCRDIDDWLRPQIYRDAPAHNAGVAAAAVTRYRGSVQSSLHQFCQLAKGRADPLLRVRTQAARLLILIALAWEEGERYQTSVDTLRRAHELAEGSPAMFEVETALQRCVALAALPRRVAAARRSHPARKRRPLIPGVALAILIGVAGGYLKDVMFDRSVTPSREQDNSMEDARKLLEIGRAYQNPQPKLRPPFDLESPRPSGAGGGAARPHR